MLAVSPHVLPPAFAQSGGHSLRFYGNGSGNIDRVKIKIDNLPVPADVGATDFTIEFWMKASVSENSGTASCNQNDGWITGNIVFDRDIWGAGDYGDFGISLSNGRIAFGVNNGSDGTTLCSQTVAADGAWHHVAVMRRRSDGLLRIFVNGQLDAESTGAGGDVSYRDGRSTSFPNDPFLVIGAEKHDAGSAYPSYSGRVDEVRLSNSLRYTSNFTPPSAPFTSDGNTVALYHFDEGPAGPCTGNVLDSSGASGGPSSGTCRYGGSPAGPVYDTDTPFAGAQPTNTPTHTPTPTNAATPPPPPVIVETPAVAPLASFAIVRWRTNIQANSVVHFDTVCDTWTRVVTDTAQVIAHTVVLTDLTPSTEYCYQVRSGNTAGETAWTANQLFATLVSEFRVYLPIILKAWVSP
jgi:hypothetical protein